MRSPSRKAQRISTESVSLGNLILSIPTTYVILSATASAIRLLADTNVFRACREKEDQDLDSTSPSKTPAQYSSRYAGSHAFPQVTLTSDMTFDVSAEASIPEETVSTEATAALRGL